MSWIDVCNGDADGLCALVQLRHDARRDGVLVTGLKRDVALVSRVTARAGDVVTVLDVSFDRNRDAVIALLDAGATVRYFDHHSARAVPTHPRLQAHIDEAAHTCTSVIVDRHLAGRHRTWAIAAAFGDNLEATALALSRESGLDDAATATLRRAGTAINYNAYGETPQDVLIEPAALFERMVRHRTALDFAAGDPIVDELDRRRDADLACARAQAPLEDVPGYRVVMLPDAPWSRRVLGPYANALSLEHPDKALAVLRPIAHGAYTVSVRAPRGSARSAVALCTHFATGGGRRGAAGVDRLEAAQLAPFLDAFRAWAGGS